jgi:hypothetical protein
VDGEIGDTEEKRLHEEEEGEEGENQRKRFESVSVRAKGRGLMAGER